jgi:tRNA/tmRNA/rRNA uracil-C5-methylase (TrmA/RlmC/RlmD family)
MAEPFCEYFGVCGGCSLQNVDYPVQVERKREMISLSTGFSDVKAFFGEPRGYRSRMDFAFHPGGIGFRKKGGWDSQVFDVKDCPISDDRIKSSLMELRAFFTDVDSFDTVRRLGTFRYAVVRAPPGDSAISFVLAEDSPGLKDAVEKIREFSLKTGAQNVAAAYVKGESDNSLSPRYTTLKGSDHLCESYLGAAFRYPIQGFFQNNHHVAEMMHRYCTEILRNHDTADAHLLDLYGGVGTFGILNAPLFKSATIVESDPLSIESARANILGNDAKNVLAFALDAARIEDLSLEGPLYVVTDPPRAGMHPAAIRRLNALSPEAILYVSCNPRQLQREIQRFPGYAVRSAALFDMFPQTPHAEAVVELVRT